MFVLGTAGHVDHGKSTLLRALTGMEPDRLPEEKKRGMTIDLNFVWCELPLYGTVGIVDVPGHEKFVGNLIAGLSGIDAFIFVVAADDGWMPQSEEHLNLLRGLKIRSGLVVLTKVDLVSPERVREVTGEIAQKFESAGLSASIVSFSSEIEGASIGVKRELEKLVSQLPKPVTNQPARLWVDRVFSPKGQGTVVTGTLRGGEFRVGSEVLLLPSRRTVTVRGLQSHEKSIERAIPNCRLAIQLGAGDTKGLKRGELVTTDLKQSLSDVVDVMLTPDGKFTPKKALKVGFHLGTLSIPASFSLLSSEPGICFGRLRLSKKIPVNTLDRFVIRTSGEERTIGCGEVIDTRADQVKLSHAKTKLSKDAATTKGNASYWLTTHRVILDEDASRLSDSDYLKSATYLVEDKLFDKKLWDEALENLKSETPEKAMVEKLGVTRSVALQLFAALESKELISREGGKLRLNAAPSRGEGDKLVDALLPGLTPILLSAQLKDAKTKGILQKLILDKKIIRLADDHFLSAGAYADHAKKVETLIRKKGSGTTSELKDLLGCSRKFAVMILERLDSDRVTYLKDGVRKLLKG